MSAARSALKVIETAIDHADEALAIVNALGPIGDQIKSYIFGDGPEPAVFEQLPELRAPAALERARHRARVGSTPPTA